MTKDINNKILLKSEDLGLKPGAEILRQSTKPMSQLAKDKMTKLVKEFMEENK